MFTTPAHEGFSEAFSASEIQQLYESKDKSAYEALKKKVQREILSRFQQMEWDFDVTGFNASIISELKRRITPLGFSIQHLDYKYDSETKLKIFIKNDSPEEDEGYLSEGWNPKFKASRIKAKKQKILNMQFAEISKLIEDTMKSYPEYHQYNLKLNCNTSPIVMGWIAESLNKRGFTATLEEGTRPINISDPYSEHYVSFIIINSKVRNYKEKEILSI